MVTSGAVRPYQEQDFASLAALVDAITAPERHFTSTGLRSFLSVPGYDPCRDAFVAPATDGDRLVGTRDVRVTARAPHRNEEVLILESWGGERPEERGGEVAGALMAAALARAGHLLTERDRTRGVFQARCDADDAASRDNFEAHGLRYARDLVSMLRTDLDALPAPSPPAAIALTGYRVGGDDAGWVAAFNEAFADHWGGFMGMSPEAWSHYLHEPAFEPALSLVARDGAEIAGFCHCRIDRELNALTGRRVGTIRYVGVRPRWRRRGLGAALTLAGLRALRAAGMTSVSLGVNAENVTGARRLYERYGFEVVGRQVMYRREIAAARGAES